ncbi:hypothetical protein TNCV_3503151 [Trichonephila clavipes]|uniref:Uncharacterized protein n=1 Tax=Trichonephila clavipes TaxID=2585209 RepID=A0A8X6V7Q8_TRICX|nr:hypothetical protein TNCV_3503151 [Trichonephila clavipes]
MLLENVSRKRCSATLSLHSKDSVFRTPVIEYRYNTCRRPFSSSFGTKEKNHVLCRSSLQTTFKHQEEESSLLRCEIVFKCRSVKIQLCAFPSDDSCSTAYAGQFNMFLGRSNNGRAVHMK